MTTVATTFFNTEGSTAYTIYHTPYWTLVHSFLLQVIMGKRVSHSSELDSDLAAALLACHNGEDFSVVLGDTMCTSDFYEGEWSSHSFS